MVQAVSAEAIAQFQQCLELTADVTRHAEANQMFAELQAKMADEGSLAAALLDMVWKELIAARRSAAFWEQISDAEQHMSEQIVANHTNLQQNYLRLMQEM